MYNQGRFSQQRMSRATIAQHTTNLGNTYKKAWLAAMPVHFSLQSVRRIFRMETLLVATGTCCLCTVYRRREWPTEQPKRVSCKPQTALRSIYLFSAEILSVAHGVSNEFLRPPLAVRVPTAPPQRLRLREFSPFLVWKVQMPTAQLIAGSGSTVVDTQSSPSASQLELNTDSNCAMQTVLTGSKELFNVHSKKQSTFRRHSEHGAGVNVLEGETLEGARGSVALIFRDRAYTKILRRSALFVSAKEQTTGWVSVEGWRQLKPPGFLSSTHSPHAERELTDTRNKNTGQEITCKQCRSLEQSCYRSRHAFA